MGEIIALSSARPIPPKVTNHEHAGHRYRIEYDPNSKCWVWIVTITRTYNYVGEAATAEGASRDARRKIHILNRMQIETEERDVAK